MAALARQPLRYLMESFGAEGGSEAGPPGVGRRLEARQVVHRQAGAHGGSGVVPAGPGIALPLGQLLQAVGDVVEVRSEEHTSELQSLMRISYAVLCLKKKKINIHDIG